MNGTKLRILLLSAQLWQKCVTVVNSRRVDGLWNSDLKLAKKYSDAL